MQSESKLIESYGSYEDYEDYEYYGGYEDYEDYEFGGGRDYEVEEGLGSGVEDEDEVEDHEGVCSSTVDEDATTICGELECIEAREKGADLNFGGWNGKFENEAVRETKTVIESRIRKNVWHHYRARIETEVRTTTRLFVALSEGKDTLEANPYICSFEFIRWLLVFVWIFLEVHIWIQFLSLEIFWVNCDFCDRRKGWLKASEVRIYRSKR
ncbi:unnamed protein product [Blepharisma stoltei]|uniref:Uncharacterized protein n=1 Tax=Blepharisma stoltei TaxID=1481888 RepID=A0AAU9IGI9_9CILI|nr:unnamed protein product [Blepharisma stoltei]